MSDDFDLAQQFDELIVVCCIVVSLALGFGAFGVLAGWW